MILFEVTMQLSNKECLMDFVYKGTCSNIFKCSQKQKPIFVITMTDAHTDNRNASTRPLPYIRLGCVGKLWPHARLGALIVYCMSFFIDLFFLDSFCSFNRGKAPSTDYY